MNVRDRHLKSGLDVGRVLAVTHALGLEARLQVRQPAVGGTTRPSFGSRLGLPSKVAVKLLDQVLERTAGPIARLDPVALPFAQPVLRRLQKTLDSRRRQLT